MIKTKSHGFKFITFLNVQEDDIYNYKRLAGSYAVIMCNDKYLLCYNNRRKQWEIPAGKREKNETPRECAARELYEETGQIVLELEFKGLVKSKKKSNGKVKYNPVYFSVLDGLQPFLKNKETCAITLWDGKEDIGYIDKVDLKLLKAIKKDSLKI